MSELTSRRPYMVRAIYEWLADNGLTPYILVDATYPGVKVPAHVVQDGKVVLNIGMQATHGLELGHVDIEFDARFGGVSHHLVLPMDGLLAIYARENGEGMAFPPGPDADEEDASAEAGNHGEFAVVELLGDDGDEPAPAAASLTAAPKPQVVPESADDDDTPPAPRPSGRPSLKVVK